jgi:steroid 5-alpha reductase family enzyme
MFHFLLFVIVIISITLIILIARYSYQVATRTGRSRVGFVWLSILFPAVAWIVCLVIDKDESRYEALICGGVGVDPYLRHHK